MGKMLDLGRKPSMAKALPESGSTAGHAVSYPSMYIDGKHPIHGKIGKVIHAKVKLRKMSHSIHKGKDGTSHNHQFDVLAIDPGQEMADDTENEMDSAMDESNHEDGGKVNSQSQIMAGLDVAEKKNAKRMKKSDD